MRTQAYERQLKNIGKELESRSQGMPPRRSVDSGRQLMITIKSCRRSTGYYHLLTSATERSIYLYGSVDPISVDRRPIEMCSGEMLIVYIPSGPLQYTRRRILSVDIANSLPESRIDLGHLLEIGGRRGREGTGDSAMGVGKSDQQEGMRMYTLAH